MPYFLSQPHWNRRKCNELAEKAHELGMEVLLEIHSSEELAYINKGIDMIGVNNRNLGTFFTDVENSFRLAEQLLKIRYWYQKVASPILK